MSGPPIHSMMSMVQSALDRVDELSKAHQALAKRVVDLEQRATIEILKDPPPPNTYTGIPDIVKDGGRRGQH